MNSCIDYVLRYLIFLCQQDQDYTNQKYTNKDKFARKGFDDDDFPLGQLLTLLYFSSPSFCFLNYFRMNHHHIKNPTEASLAHKQERM